MLEKIINTYSLFQELHNQDDSIIDDQEMLPIRSAFQEVNYYSSEIPRIMLLGEFKSGKSTLLNALFGKNLAATDILEMTSWVARYWYSDEPFCKITFKSGKVLNDSPEEFYKKCQNREFTKDELNEIDRVDIGIDNKEMKCSIIDAPGFGSTTYENENRMLNAIQESDFIFWVISCEVVGSMREAAIIKNIIEKGTPILCVLTKCDYINSDEITSIIEYLNENFKIEKNNVFPVSALEYMNNPSNIEEVERINKLKDYINNHISVSHLELRKQSQESHLIRIAEHSSYILNRIIRDVKQSIEARDRYSALVSSIKNNINLKVDSQLSNHVKNTMYTPYREKLVNEINSLNDKITEESITNIFSSVLPPTYMDEYMTSLMLLMQESLNKLWKEGLKEASDEIIQIQNSMAETAFSKSLTLGLNIDEFVSNASVLADETIKTGLMTSLGVAGVATMWAAILGPGAAYVTMGMALSGVGIPIAIMGVGVTLAIKYFYKKNKGKNTNRGQEIMEQVINHFLQTVITKDYINKIYDINSDFESILVKKFEENICSKFPSKSIDDMLRILNNALTSLQSISIKTASQSNQPSNCPYCAQKLELYNGKYCKNCGNYVG